eukprot:505930_1
MRDLTDLCFNYLNEEMNKFEAMKNNTVGSMCTVYSPVFIVNHFKWIAWIEVTKTQLVFSLALIALRFGLKMKIRWKVFLVELNQIFSGKCTGNSHFDGGFKHKLVKSFKLHRPHIQHLHHITFDITNVILNEIPANLKTLKKPLPVRTANRCFNCKLNQKLMNKIKDEHIHYDFFKIFEYECYLKIDKKHISFSMNKHKGRETECESYAFYLVLQSNELVLSRFLLVQADYNRSECEMTHEIMNIDRILETNVRINIVLIDISESVSHYVWKVPRMTRVQALHVCHRYIRNYVQKYKTAYIPSDIMQLCSVFLHDDAKDSLERLNKCTWKLRSEPFKMDVFKWTLDVFNNATKNAKDFSLALISSSQKVDAVWVFVRLKFDEFNFQEERFITFTKMDLCKTWWNPSVLSDDLQSVTIGVELRILDVYDTVMSIKDEYKKYHYQR